MPPAPPAPYTVRLTAPRHVASLAELDPAERDGLAAALIRTVRRLDRLFQEPVPYQLWTSRPAHGSPDGHVSVTVAGLLRPGRPRILGAAELATASVHPGRAVQDGCGTEGHGSPARAIGERRIIRTDTAADRAGTTASLVVARAPLRVSLAGGGTDLPSYPPTASEAS